MACIENDSHRVSFTFFKEFFIKITFKYLEYVSLLPTNKLKLMLKKKRRRKKNPKIPSERYFMNNLSTVTFFY